MAAHHALRGDKSPPQPLALSSLPKWCELPLPAGKGTAPSKRWCRVSSTPPQGTHWHLDTQRLWVSQGGMVLGPARTLLLWEAPMRVASPRWLAVLLATSQPRRCLCRHPMAPKSAQGGSCRRPQPHTCSPSPKVHALVTPIDLQPLTEAFFYPKHLQGLKLWKQR